MSAWKQWWNCLNNRPSDDDWIEWLMDFTGFMPVLISIHALLIVGFIAYCIFLERWYMKRPLKDE